MDEYKQVNFSCPIALYNRLKRQKELLDRPILELIIAAIEDKLEQIEGKDALPPERTHADTRSVHLQSDHPKRIAVYSTDELYWVNIWRKYMRKMPKPFVEAQQVLLRDSLRFFSSARLNTVRGEANGETRSE